jgi:hypothetical protein
MKFCALGVGRVCECERDGNGQVTRQKEQKRMKDNKYYKMVVFKIEEREREREREKVLISR